MIATITAGLAACASTLLRGFQNKSVAANNKRAAFFVGGLMSLCDVSVISLVAKNTTVPVIATSAIGAATGWICGMYLHDRANRRRLEVQKAIKKSKRRKRIDNAVATRLKELGIQT